MVLASHVVCSLQVQALLFSALGAVPRLIQQLLHTPSTTHLDQVLDELVLLSWGQEDSAGGCADMQIPVFINGCIHSHKMAIMLD